MIMISRHVHTCTDILRLGQRFEPSNLRLFGVTSEGKDPLSATVNFWLYSSLSVSLLH